MELDAVDLAAMHLGYEQEGAVIAFDGVHSIIIDEVARRIEDRASVIDLNPLRCMVGMPPIHIRPQIDHLMGQCLDRSRRLSPVRADMGTDDHEHALTPQCADQLLYSGAVWFDQFPRIVSDEMHTGTGGSRFPGRL